MFFAKTKIKTRRRQGYGGARKKISHETRQGIYVIVLLLASVVSFATLTDKAGEFGFGVNIILNQLLGCSKWALPLLFLFTAVGVSKKEKKNFNSTNLFGLFLFVISFSALMHFYCMNIGGGYLGKMLVKSLLPMIGPWLLAIIFSSLLILSLLLVLDSSLSDLFGEESFVFRLVALVLGILFYPFLRKKGFATAVGYGVAKDDDDDIENIEESHEREAVVREYSSYAEASEGKGIDGEEMMAQKGGPPTLIRASAWRRSNVKMDIPLSLLKNKPKKPTSGNIDKNQDVIRRTLDNFGIPITMGEVRVGPSVTQYTFKPKKGIPLSRLKPLSDDLSMELALHPVRMEAPIPGKSLVGLEVPNQTKVMVSLKEVLASKEFKARTSNTAVALGRDVTGSVWLDDLAKMPHLLVAGATNSGKSVFLHSLITSLLYQNDPDDLKLILIDVKQVELTPYNDLPYLIAPVVTDSTRALRSLKWCLSEMERRLTLMREAKCDNIRAYHKKGMQMPYLVVVVDELGDIMATAKKDAEASIIRLGQKARAAGIHLVLAMQRPSVDILSGLIKANMPGRISFQVTSSVNSKTIIEHTGAEKLIGQGDMLFMTPSLNKPIRIQGAYISKEEVRSVVRYIKKKAGKAKYINDITELKTGQLQTPELDEVDDELLDEAKEMIFKYSKASATMLQSRLSIGYPRANRILDVLEKQGVVGPSIQNKPREVYADEM